MRAVFTPEAETSLALIGDFIARDNPGRAVTFMEELRTKALGLCDLPHGFPLVPRYERRGVRRRSWRGYGILYGLSGDCVVILRFVGPGQDHDRLLGLGLD
jgi:plasmid stabilization system protein ParE